MMGKWGQIFIAVISHLTPVFSYDKSYRENQLIEAKQKMEKIVSCPKNGFQFL